MQIAFEYTEDMKRLSVAPIKRKAEAMGLDTPYALWKAMGKENITANTVRIWWGDVQMGRIDVDVWSTFADFFQCSMLELIEEIDIN